MNKQDNHSQFKEEVYRIVQSVPAGRVLTYGLLALLAGRRQNARLVGRLMAEAPLGVPVHRIVTGGGRTVPGWFEQIELLKKEGVAFKANGCIDMKKHLWQANHI